ncbi:MAG TPA: AI-2E family transporter [Acetobacteraceae bacterium]|nr:AI-2E family transporter [Acetobacteraceae bacterium]
MTLAGASIIIGMLYLGRELLVPVVLSVLLAFVLAPVVRLLQRIRLGRVLSVVIAALLAMLTILGIGLAMSRQAAQFAENLPEYQAAIRAKVEHLRVLDWIAHASNLVRGGTDDVPAVPAQASAPPAAAQAGNALEQVRGVAESLLAPLATVGLVVVFVFFVLLYREDLRDRLISLAGTRDLHRTMSAMDDAAWRLSRYFLTQVAMNGGFGVFIAISLWLMGLPNPILWGILAGLMRFVPFIGTPIAVVPPVLLAIAVDPGWTLALSVLALYVVSETLMGQVAEPLLYGHSTGLAPIAVIAAVTFWAFLWGPIGLIVAVPLTVCLVVLGRHVERLQFLAVMLGDQPPLAPEEIFYRRALEGDADGLVDQARRHLRSTGPSASLVSYFDEVALRGIALAQSDWSREILESERMVAIRRQVEMLLEELAEDENSRSEDARAVPPEWRQHGVVLCVAGQGPFDGLGASMAALLLQSHGIGARAAPNAVLDTTHIGELDPTGVRLCCLSVLEQGSSATSVRYFLRRLRRRLPQARVAIGLWHVAPGSPMLTALSTEGAGETIVTSIGELLALCQAAMAAADTPTLDTAPPGRSFAEERQGVRE